MKTMRNVLYTGYPYTIVSNYDTFKLHRSLDGGNITCGVISVIDSILRYKDDASTDLFNDIKLPKESIIHIEQIKNEIESGFITINNVKIDLSTYEPDGEYAEVDAGKNVYILYNIKKYYSVVKGQYTFFLTDGRIKIIDKVECIDISKDVRITKEEVEKLWRA